MKKLTKDNIIDYIIDCGKVLDEANVPENDRFFLIVPAPVSALLRVYGERQIRNLSRFLTETILGIRVSLAGIFDDTMRDNAW